MRGGPALALSDCVLEVRGEAAVSLSDSARGVLSDLRITAVGGDGVALSGGSRALERRRPSLIARVASGVLAAILAARALARGISSPWGTVSETRPMRAASRPSITSPVSISSAALAPPTSAGNL